MTNQKPIEPLPSREMEQRGAANEAEQRSSLEFTQDQLQFLSEILWAYADEGPPGAGWASESLRKLRENVDSAMIKLEPEGPTNEELCDILARWGVAQ